MNQEKIREYFSALYEGSLEAGLRTSVEQQLRADPLLQGDYSAFVSAMEDLKVLPGEEIEIPNFLSDRVATRLEQERAARRRVVPVWTSWLRGLAFAGVGAAAVAVAVLSFHSSGQSSVANLLPGSSDDQPSFSVNGGVVVLNYRPGSARSVVVSSGVTGREMQRFSVDASAPAHSFENGLPGTALFDVQIVGDASAYIVVVPGSSVSGSGSTSGSVKDLAVALAGQYHMPVVVHAADRTRRLKWKLDGLDAGSSAAKALAGEPYVADERSTGILLIGDR